MNPIKFEGKDGEQYRFRKDSFNNITIEKYSPNNKYERNKWRRVTGYHNTLTIQRELAEYLIPEQATEIMEYHKQLIATLADIGMQLGALIDNE